MCEHSLNSIRQYAPLSGMAAAHAKGRALPCGLHLDSFCPATDLPEVRVAGEPLTGRCHEAKDSGPPSWEAGIRSRGLHVCLYPVL